MVEYHNRSVYLLEPIYLSLNCGVILISKTEREGVSGYHRGVRRAFTCFDPSCLLGNSTAVKKLHPHVRQWTI